MNKHHKHDTSKLVSYIGTDIFDLIDEILDVCIQPGLRIDPDTLERWFADIEFYKGCMADIVQQVNTLENA